MQVHKDLAQKVNEWPKHMSDAQLKKHSASYLSYAELATPLEHAAPPEPTAPPRALSLQLTLSDCHI